MLPLRWNVQLVRVLSLCSILLPIASWPRAAADVVSAFGGEERYLTEWFTDVAVGDFNADGWPDVALAQDLVVAIWINDGHGKLVRDGQLAFSRMVSSIASADVDGDGAADLAVAIPTTHHERGEVAILSSLGNGRFSLPTFLPAGFFPSDVHATDINRDGRLDLVVANSEMVSTYVGRGDGTFGPRLDSGMAWPGTDDVSRFMSLGDVDGDTKLDAVVAPGARAGIEILRGRGDGTFWPPMGQSVEVRWNVAPLLQDLDADGWPDLIVVTPATDVVVLWNDGFADFASAARDTLVEDNSIWEGPSVLVGNLDGQGHIDIAISSNNGYASRVHVFRVEGHRRIRSGPTFTVWRGYDGSRQISLWGLADLDRSGSLDLLTFRNRSLGIFRHVSGMQYQAFTEYPLALDSRRGPIHAVDISGDGTHSILHDTARGLEVLRFTSDGWPRDTTMFAPSACVGTADLDRDGRMDLILSGDHALELALASSEGSWVRAGRWADTRLLCVGDFDGMRGPDLALIDGSHVLRVWLVMNDGTGHFSSHALTGVTLPSEPWERGAAVAGDLNGDRMDELIVCRNGARGDDWDVPDRDTVTIYRNQGNGRFDVAGEVALPDMDEHIWSRPNEAAVADFNRDGALDLCVLRDQSSYTNMVSIDILINAGNRILVPWRRIHALGEGPSGLTVADFNLDGWLDVACIGSIEGSMEGRLTVNYNSPDAVFVREDHSIDEGRGYSVSIGDMNQDLKPDLLIGWNRIQDIVDGTAGSLRVLLNATPPAPRPLDVPTQGEMATAGRHLTIESIGPNPTSGVATLQLALPTSEPCDLELFDISGRRVHRHTRSGLAPGVTRIRLAPEHRLAPGLYWVRARQGDRTARAKLVVIQ